MTEALPPQVEDSQELILKEGAIRLTAPDIIAAIDRLTEAVSKQRPLVPLVLFLPEKISEGQARQIAETVHSALVNADLMTFGGVSREPDA